MKKQNRINWAAEDLETQITLARMTDAHEESLVHIIGFYLACSAMTYFFADSLTSSKLLLWYAQLMLLTTSFVIFYRLDHLSSLKALKQKVKAGYGVVILLGLTWAIYPHLVFLDPGLDKNPTYNFIFAGALCVICVNAAPLLVLLSFRAYMLHVTIILTSMAIFTLRHPAYDFNLVATFLGIYWACLYAQNKKLEDTLVKNIKTQLVAISAQEAATQANQDKSHFISAASHDIRQPVQAMIYLIERLSRDVPKHLRLPVKQLEYSVETLSRLLKGLLDISRLDAGKMTANLSNVDVKTILEVIYNSMKLDARKKNLDFILEADSAICHTDPILLGRILGNLVSNAIKYTNKGKVLIRAKHAENNKLLIDIIDTGIGIPESARAEIFKEYYQIDNNSHTQGLGLGLSIVKKSAAILDLKFDFTSSSAGTSFCLELDTAEEQTLPKVHKPTEIQMSIEGSRIFYIEDNENVRDSILENLEHEGCVVTTAANYEQAIEILASLDRPPQIILADYQLPNNHLATELITAVKEKFDDSISSIILTGETRNEVILNTAKQCDILLHKPIRPQALSYAINQLLS